jgi:hypothetical protein
MVLKIFMHRPQPGFGDGKGLIGKPGWVTLVYWDCLFFAPCHPSCRKGPWAAADKKSGADLPAVMDCGHICFFGVTFGIEQGAKKIDPSCKQAIGRSLICPQPNLIQPLNIGNENTP